MRVNHPAYWRISRSFVIAHGIIDGCAFLLQLKLFFTEVTFAKPKSSRNSSIGENADFFIVEAETFSLILHYCINDKLSDRFLVYFTIEAFAVCENYSPPEGFNEKDLHHLLEKVGSPSGADDLGTTLHHYDFKCLTFMVWISKVRTYF